MRAANERRKGNTQCGRDGAGWTPNGTFAQKTAQELPHVRPLNHVVVDKGRKGARFIERGSLDLSCRLNDGHGLNWTTDAAVGRCALALKEMKRSGIPTLRHRYPMFVDCISGAL